MTLPRIWISTDEPIKVATSIRDAAIGAFSYYELSHSTAGLYCLRHAENYGFNLQCGKGYIDAYLMSQNDEKYDDYKSSVRRTLLPIIASLGKYKTLRLNMQREKDIRYKLPPMAAKFLDHFTDQANKDNLHIIDWRRFYQFVRIAPKRLTPERLREILEQSGFSRQRAEELADVYWHLCLFRQPPTAAEVFERLMLRGRLPAHLMGIADQAAPGG